MRRDEGVFARVFGGHQNNERMQNKTIQRGYQFMHLEGAFAGAI
jgi:hypothetical protein